jgi:hypothetical protein
MTKKKWLILVVATVVVCFVLSRIGALMYSNLSWVEKVRLDQNIHPYNIQRFSLPNDVFILTIPFWIIFALTKKKYPKTRRIHIISSWLLYLCFTLLLLQGIVYHVFISPYEDTPIASETISFEKVSERHELFSDCEFIFPNTDKPEPFKVYTNEDGSLQAIDNADKNKVNLFTYNPVYTYNNGLNGVTFWVNRMLDLNFNTCTEEKLFDDITYDNEYFIFLFEELSESGDIIYSIRYNADVWHRDTTLADLNPTDVAIHGIWLYNNETGVSKHLKKMPIAFNSDRGWDLEVNWESRILTIFDESCPVDGCMVSFE